jgi:tyramine---L-glutamate ligase
MMGSGVPAEGRSLTILVFEYVTGGGLAGRELPASWAAEGAAMRRAISEDFASVPGVRVVMTLDARFPVEDSPGVEVRTLAHFDRQLFETLAAQADYTVVIAPETQGLLAYLTSVVEEAGSRSLGSSGRAIKLTGDKSRFADHLRERNVPTPLTRTLWRGPRDWPTEWEGPIVLKPRFGAGAVDTVVVRDGLCPAWVTLEPMFVAQPYLRGEPMSASFLVDSENQSTLLAIGRQRIDVDESGRISYRGGTIPAGLDGSPWAVDAAIDSANVRGFVGVDFLFGNRGEAVVLEINPRPTTSYVGLARMFPPGTIAGAWLASAAGALKETEWLDRIRAGRKSRAISFDADGTIHLEGLPP